MKKLYVIVVIMLIISNLFNKNVYADTYDHTYTDRFTYNYEFSSGANSTETFALGTQTNKLAVDELSENIRRNKDVTYNPLGYGIFSGQIDTGRSNPYIQPESRARVHDTTYTTLDERLYNKQNNLNVTNNNLNSNSNHGGILQPTSLISPSTLPVLSNTSNNVTTNIVDSNNNYYKGDEIGRLSIPKLNLNIKVFEGESQENMKKGIGHFESTPIWNGNIGIAGHNRGSAGYFEDIEYLNYGDEIVYETKFGLRKYKVTLIEQISDVDYSYLKWSDRNMITLITCVKNKPDKRWVVQSIEKK